MKNETTKGQHGISPAAVFAVAAVSALIGFAAVYVTLGRPDNGGTIPEKAQVEGTGAAAAPIETPPKGAPRGALTGFVYKAAPEDLPEVTFTDAAGTQKTLSDFKGKTVLLNLWATWCAPCREEMPSLDRLQKELGSEKFEVVALAVDRGGVDAARKFLETIKVESLATYVDATSRSAPALRAVGMPTTILIDKDGREIGRLPGPAAWDSAEAKTLIEAAMR